MKVAVVWENFGPYHRARLDALRRSSGAGEVLGVQISERTETYAWIADPSDKQKRFFYTLLPGRSVESASALSVFIAFFRFLRKQKPTLVFLPSYWPASSAALLLAAKFARVKTVMMNESHAGTERSRGLARAVKCCLVRLFDGGIVGGKPHIRHFISLGLRKDRLFDGYDVVDNEFFRSRSREVRASAEQHRSDLRLPSRFVLNIGRMVPKKNLRNLVIAYSRLIERWNGAKIKGVAHAGTQMLHDDLPALVLVGSGEEERELRALCASNGLMVVDRVNGCTARDCDERIIRGVVFFYGFRQVDELPAFYALADVFVLPSYKEEWGLVVNEAMAAGLPVIVSRVAGCAEDLVEEGGNGFTFDPENIEELTHAMLTVLSSREGSQKMAERSRAIIERWNCDYFGEQASIAIKRIILGVSE